MQERTRIAQRKFLKAYAHTANMGVAAEAAGIHRTLVYRWQELYPQFAVRMNAAREEAYDKLEQEALRRAVRGVTHRRPVVVKGQVVDEEITTEYSDRLLEILLKAARPDKFRERQSVEHSGPQGGPISIDVAEQRSELASRIASLVARAAAPALPDVAN